MKNLLRLVTTLSALTLPVMISATLLAQNSAPAPTDPTPPTSATNPAPAASALLIAPGSVIPVQLIKTLDAKNAKTGDEVVAKVTMDMKGEGGTVLVPKDTKVIGHVTEAQARNRDQKESQLAIAFDRAVVKQQPVALPMSIQAVIAERSDNDIAGAPGVAPSPSSTGTSGASPMAGRSPSSPMSGQTQSPPSGPPDGSGAAAGNAHPHINAQTQGVIGMLNLTLSPTSNARQGSTLTSDKNNVKLESGTMLLLRVNQ